MNWSLADTFVTSINFDYFSYSSSFPLSAIIVASGVFIALCIPSDLFTDGRIKIVPVQ